MKISTCKDLDNYSKETIFAYIIELQSNIMELNILLEHSSEQIQKNVDDLSNQIDVLGNKLKESTDNQFIHMHEISRLRELLKKEQAKNSKLTDDNKLLTMQFTDKKNECKSLKSRVKDLENRLDIKTELLIDHYNTPSSKKLVKPTSSEDKRAKKGGAKKNHKGKGRSKITESNADKKIEIRKPDDFCCIHDHEQLTYRGEKERAYIKYIPGHFEKVIEKSSLYECRLCGRTYSWESDEVMPRAMYSNQTKSILCEEVFCYPHSIGEVVKRYDINRGTLINIFHDVADILAPIYDFQKIELLNSSLVQIDETGWREDGVSSYCWNMMNDDISHFKYISSRASFIPSKIFGILPKYKFSNQGKKIKLTEEEQKNYLLNTVIISDFYGGYNNLPVRKQRCFEHYKRMLEGFEKDNDCEAIKQFVSDVKPLIIAAITIDHDLPFNEYLEKASIIEANIKACMDRDYNDAAVAQYQSNFWDYKEQLFHWVNNKSVDSHNNKCESSIRPVAIDRAVVFGSQSERGLRTRSIISSVMQTVKKRNLNPVDFLTSLLNALTRNPSLDVVDFYLKSCNLKREIFKIQKPLNYFLTLPSDNGEYQGEYPNWSINKLPSTYLTDEFDWKYLNDSNAKKKNLNKSIEYKDLTKQEIRMLESTLTDLKTNHKINYVKIKNKGFFLKMGKNPKRCKKKKTSTSISENNSTLLKTDDNKKKDIA